MKQYIEKRIAHYQECLDKARVNRIESEYEPTSHKNMVANNVENMCIVAIRELEDCLEHYEKYKLSFK